MQNNSQYSWHTRSENKAIFMAVMVFILLGFVNNVIFIFKYPLTNDHISHALIIDDVVSNYNCFLYDWYIPQNNYLFTDMPYYFLTWMLFGMSPLTFKLGGALIYFLIALLLTVILKDVYGYKTATIGLLFYCALPPELSTFIYFPFFHAGTVLFALAGLYVVLKTGKLFDTERIGYKHVLSLILLVPIVTLGVFSDYLIFVIFVAPAFAAVAIVSFWHKQPPIPVGRVAIFTVILAVSSLFGMAWLNIIEKMGLHMAFAAPFTFNFNYLRIPAMVAKLIHGLSTLFGMEFDVQSTSALEGTLSTIYFVFFIVSLWGVMGMLKTSDSLSKRMLSIYSLSLFATLCVAYACKNVAHPYYLMPIAIFYIISLSQLIARAGNKLRIVFLLLIFTVIAGTGIGAIKQEKKQPHAGLAEFISEKGLKYGYSGINHANILTFFGKGRFKVRPVRFDNYYYIQPNIFWVNAKWYDSRSNNSQTFLVKYRHDKGEGFGFLSDGLVSQMFGRPSRVYQFNEEIRIYVWNYNIIREYYRNEFLRLQQRGMR